MPNQPYNCVLFLKKALPILKITSTEATQMNFVISTLSSFYLGHHPSTPNELTDIADVQSSPLTVDKITLYHPYPLHSLGVGPWKPASETSNFDLDFLRKFCLNPKANKEFQDICDHLPDFTAYAQFHSDNIVGNEHSIITLLMTLLDVICSPCWIFSTEQNSGNHFGFVELAKKVIQSVIDTKNSDLCQSAFSELSNRVSAHPLPTVLHQLSDLFFRTSRSSQGFNRKKLFIPQQNPFGTFLASFNQFESSDAHLLNSPSFLPISRSEQISVRLHVLSDLLKSSQTVPDDDEFVPLLSLLSTPEQLSTTSQRTLSSIFAEVISVRIRNQKGQAAFVLFDTITDILLTLLGRLPDSPKESVPLSFITDFLETTNNFLQYIDCSPNALGFRKDGREGSTARNPLNPTILTRTIRLTSFDHDKGLDLIQKLFDSQSSFDVLVKEGIVAEMISWSEELLKAPDTTHAFEHQNAEQTFRLFNRLYFAIISHSHSNVRRGELGTLVQTLRNNRIKLDETNAQFLEISLSEIPKDKSQQFVHALTRNPNTTLWGPLFLEQNIVQTISSLNHHATENNKWMEEFINSEGLVRFVIHLIQLLLSEAPLDQEVPFTTHLLRSSRQNSPNFHSSLSSSNSLLEITSIDLRNKRDSGGLILLWTLSSVLFQHLINGTPTILRPTFSQRVSILPFTLENVVAQGHQFFRLAQLDLMRQTPSALPNALSNNQSMTFLSIAQMDAQSFNRFLDRTTFTENCVHLLIPEVFRLSQNPTKDNGLLRVMEQLYSFLVPIFSRSGNLQAQSHDSLPLSSFPSSLVSFFPLLSSHPLLFSLLALESHQQTNIVPILKKSNVSIEMLLVCVSVLCVLPRRLFDVPRSFENGVVESIADHLNTNPDHHPTGIRLITFLSHLVLSWENIRIPVVPIRRILVNAPTMGNEMLPLRLIASFLLTLIKTGKGWNQTILNQIGNDLVDHILHSFLFPSGSQSLHPIFEDDRMVLTELVMALSQPAALVPFFEEKQILVNRLPLPFLDQGERGRENNTILSRHTPKGLRNPRMACFMNAIVIQLFQNKEFSNTILSFDGRVSTTPFNHTPRHPSGMTLVDEEIKKQQRMMEESSQMEKDRIPQSLVFFHLQRIFALLCLNREGEVRVTDLAAALSDSSKQMFHENSSNDSEDFVKALLSQLDIFFHRCGYPHFASTSFGCHVVKAMNCENNHPCSTLIDPDFMFPVEIQQSSSLEDALEKMVLGKKGSTLQCLQCVPDGSRMVPGSVRKLIATPSNSVMIFMNRKTLDGQLTTNRCSFPKTLDLFPFSLEKQEVKDADRTQFVYELTGFEVYEVRNDTNHYYSVIKEGRSQMWWLFNDDKVSEFDISKMSDYFGGNGRQGYATLLFYRRLLPADDGSVNSPVLLPSNMPLGNLLSDEEERFAAEQALKRKLPSSEGQVDEEMQQEWDRTFPKSALSESEERQLERDFLTTTGLDLLQFVLNGTENHDSSRTPTNVNSNVNISHSVSQKGSGKKQKPVANPNSNVVEPEIIPHHHGTPLTLPLLQAFFHQYVHSGRRSERIWESIDRTLEKDEQLSCQFVDYLLRQLVEEDEALKNEERGKEEREQLIRKWTREEEEARQAHEEEQDRILRAFEQKIHEMEVNAHEPTQRNNRFKNKADRNKVERERPQRIPFSKKVLPSSSIIHRVHHTTSLLVSFISDCQDKDVVNRFLSTIQICLGINQQTARLRSSLSLSTAIRDTPHSQLFVFFSILNHTPRSRAFARSSGCFVHLLKRLSDFHGKTNRQMEEQSSHFFLQFISSRDFSVLDFRPQDRTTFIEFVSSMFHILISPQFSTISLIRPLLDELSLSHALLNFLSNELLKIVTTTHFHDQSVKSRFLHFAYFFFYVVTYTDADSSSWSQLVPLLNGLSSIVSRPFLDQFVAVICHFTSTHETVLDSIVSSPVFHYPVGQCSYDTSQSFTFLLTPICQVQSHNIQLHASRKFLDHLVVCPTCDANTPLLNSIQNSHHIQSLALVQHPNDLDSFNRWSRFLVYVPFNQAQEPAIGACPPGMENSTKTTARLVTSLFKAIEGFLLTIGKDHQRKQSLGSEIRTIEAHLIDPAEISQNPESIVQVSADLIRLNEELKFIQPRTVDLFLNCLLDQMTSVSAIATNTSIFQLLLLLMVSFDEETLRIRSKIAEFVLDGGLQPLLSFKLSQEQPGEVNIFRRHACLFSSYFASLLNILILLTEFDHRLAGSLNISVVDDCIRETIFERDLSQSIMNLSHYLLQTILRKACISDFLSILEKNKGRLEINLLQSNHGEDQPEAKCQFTISQLEGTNMFTTILLDRLQSEPHFAVSFFDNLFDISHPGLEQRQEALLTTLSSTQHHASHIQFFELMDIVFNFFQRDPPPRFAVMSDVFITELMKIYLRISKRDSSSRCVLKTLQVMSFIAEYQDTKHTNPTASLSLFCLYTNQVLKIFSDDRLSLSLFNPPQENDEDLRPSMFSPFLSLSTHLASLCAQHKKPLDSLRLIIPLCGLYLLLNDTHKLIQTVLVSESQTHFVKTLDTLLMDMKLSQEALRPLHDAIFHVLGKLSENQPQMTLEMLSQSRLLSSVQVLASLSLLFDPELFGHISRLFSSTRYEIQTSVRPLPQTSETIETLLDLHSTPPNGSNQMILSTLCNPLYFKQHPFLIESILPLQFVHPRLFFPSRRSICSQNRNELLEALQASQTSDASSSVIIIQRIFSYSSITFREITDPIDLRNKDQLIKLNELLVPVWNNISLFFSLENHNSNLLNTAISILIEHKQIILPHKTLLKVMESTWNCFKESSPSKNAVGMTLCFWLILTNHRFQQLTNMDIFH
ncbi:putative Ubiquitin carboxyl-terminal hydrolase [Blattamonas nauphoetae]|uniref:Ubiquitin carboxyl-terminal hydrolase n=1 Tax=Blattamonas nauphoetae TaxID=2049346 RepID=A0ABQ9YCI1_9EUKA|nr:putative Ubiquitin carboxyl-terminal hydrolase [Blattamonas nauphoetae]